MTATTNPYPPLTGGPSRWIVSATLDAAVVGGPWSVVCSVTSASICRAVTPGSVIWPPATASAQTTGSVTFWIWTVVYPWRAASAAHTLWFGTIAGLPVSSWTDQRANLARSSTGVSPTTKGSVDCADSDWTQASRSSRLVR